MSIDASSSTVVLEPEVMVDDIVVGRAVREAIRGLDALDISAIFSRRASVMRSPPKFVSGAFRSAMRVALHEIVSGTERHDEAAQCRGWKLFMFLPRLLLFRPPRDGNISKQQLLERFSAFSRGEWDQLLMQSEDCNEAANRGFHRRRGAHVDSPDRRVDRAQSLIRWEKCRQVGKPSRVPRWPQGRNVLWTSCKILCDAQPCHILRCRRRSATIRLRLRSPWRKRSS